jgi:hypothetical protein
MNKSTFNLNHILAFVEIVIAIFIIHLFLKPYFGMQFGALYNSPHGLESEVSTNFYKSKINHFSVAFKM